ncbi:MAG: cytochrome-c peroxidase [Acidobacteriota bacterium]
MRKSGFQAGLFTIPMVVLTSLFVLATCSPPEPVSEEPPPQTVSIPSPPEGFEPVSVPEDNPMSPDKIALGRQLFFDMRLSADGTRSCYACHVCEKGLTDGAPTAVGALGKKLTRSSPSLWNIAYQSEFYWDGRSGSLEKQAMAAWTGGNMGANAEEIVEKLRAIEGYRHQFQKVFGSEATPDNVVKAISAFERAFLFCAGTAYDAWRGGDEGAVSDSAKRGAELFLGKAGCGNCHSGVLLTDMKYHNVGIGMDAEEPDMGRFKVSQDEKDTGAFKTPTLRDITRSAPYFHNGSVASLEEAVDLMLEGGVDNPYLDRENLKKVELTPEERTDLLEFLNTLECPCALTEPELPE